MKMKVFKQKDSKEELEKAIELSKKEIAEWIKFLNECYKRLGSLL